MDASVPMYLVGAPHPHKHDASLRLRAARSAGRRLVTDAEVFQEILRRYSAIRRRDAIEPAFQGVVPKQVTHLAAMQRAGCKAGERRQLNGESCGASPTQQQAAALRQLAGARLARPDRWIRKNGPQQAA